MADPLEKTQLGETLDVISYQLVAEAFPIGVTTAPELFWPHYLDVLYTLDRCIDALAQTTGLTLPCRDDEGWTMPHQQVVRLADLQGPRVSDPSAVLTAQQYQGHRARIAQAVLNADDLVPDVVSALACLDQLLACLEATNGLTTPVRDDASFMTTWQQAMQLADTFGPVPP